MPKPVVFVIGASGSVGSATVQALSAKYADKVEIRAGVRNPDKADKLKTIAGVSIVQAEMGAKDELVGTFTGVNALYIVTPGVENRAELAVATAEAAKEAGVKHVVVVSVPSADLPDTVFGRQFKPIEEKISKLGVPFTILRLPFFVENHWALKDSIVGKSSIFSPVDPTKPFTAVVVEDAGRASAAILANPAKHASKTYTIISNRHSYNDVATAFSEALGKQITYVQVPYDAAKQTFLQNGFPEWQVDRFIEFLKLIDSGSPVTNVADTGDFIQITGEQPTNLKAWVAEVAGAFK